MPLTQERLKESLSYDPLTGVFVWAGPRKGVRVGAVAGAPDKDGYTLIMVDQRMYKAHRLAWLWMTGAWPVNEIDHIDGGKSNNMFENLREATHKQNAYNKPKRGYTFDKRRKAFVARINIDGKHIHLGQFKNAADAAAAYNRAAEKLHGEFARAA